MRWVLVASVALGCSSSSPPAEPPMTKARLGALVFNDPSLSTPPGQACADCHDPAAKFVDREDERSSEGVVKGRFGIRNTPTVLYAATIPPLRTDATGKVTGGLFWDGRASTLAEQAGGPLLNPLEMNNPSKAAVVERVRAAGYASAFRTLYGPEALDDVERAFGHITDALASFQQAPAFAPFSSKYDRYLAGTTTLAPAEARGLAIFEGRGRCATCHPSRPSPDGAPPLFTDFSYANLGLPRFQDSRFYQLPRELNADGERFVDRGLATTTKDPRHDGLFRTPTLRNVARTGPYGHNGYFRRLDELLAFLATRDTPGRWPPPEVPATVEREHTGALALSPQDLADLAAFLATLTDGDGVN